MSIEENKEVIRRLMDEVWNHGNSAVVDELVAADWMSHSNLPGMPADRGGGFGFIELYRTAFPDLHMTIDHLIGEGDLVAMYYTATGTHRGPLLRIPPTGKMVTVRGAGFYRLRDGQMVEQWGVNDIMSLMQQLGVVPGL